MWNERFASKDYVFGTKPAAFLIDQAAHFPAKGTVLSIADGEGRNSVFLAQKGLDVTAMEAAPNAIAKARKLADKAQVDVDFQEADIFAYDWDAVQYDLVVGVFFQFMGAAARGPIFDGVKRAVKPGGTVMLHGYTPEQIAHGTGGPGVAENMYTADQLAADFAGWEILRLTAYERELEEGAGHSGRSALIDLIAVKPA